MVSRASLSDKSWNVREKVARAFYDYGRLCSAHPITCLSISIITTLFLSWPAIAKVRLPISSPMDVYWSNTPTFDYDKNSSTPEWLYLQGCTSYIQHIIVRGVVEPWDSANKNLSPAAAVKGPLSKAFVVESILRSIKSNQSAFDFESSCLRVFSQATHSEGYNVADSALPNHSCLLVSPVLFWKSDYSKFLRDNNVLKTIFAQPCTPTECSRDILLGAPTRLTGIKQKYRTNRQRYVEYAVTLFTTKFNPEWRTALIDALCQKFKIKKLRLVDEETFIHVYYVPRKYLADYAPLLTSYFICALYFYFTVCKFEMVKSKGALASAAFITVLTTLSSTAGICSYFELTPTLWGAGLYPYLAMVITLENILCITRSVVYTPPSMSVSSRLSYGLSAGCLANLFY